MLCRIRQSARYSLAISSRRFFLVELLTITFLHVLPHCLSTLLYQYLKYFLGMKSRAIVVTWTIGVLTMGKGSSRLTIKLKTVQSFLGRIFTDLEIRSSHWFLTLIHGNLGVVTQISSHGLPET